MKKTILNIFKAAKSKRVLVLILFFFLIASFLAIWIFFIEPNLLIVKNLTIKDPELKGIKVAYLTDLHICQNEKAYFLKLIKTVNEQNADIILLGGDYVVVDMFMNKTMEAKEIAQLLTGFKAKYGVYMVMGNHELHGKSIEILTDCLKDTNIKILQNTNVRIKIRDKSLSIVGIGDYSDRRHNIKKAFNNAEKPIIAFTHSPSIFRLLPNNVNMTFAGHTHGGQVYLPGFGPLAKPRGYKGIYVKGFYEKQGKTMFVSSGIGCSHLKARLFNLPEIVIADFK